MPHDIRDVRGFVADLVSRQATMLRQQHPSLAEQLDKPLPLPVAAPGPAGPEGAGAVAGLLRRNGLVWRILRRLLRHDAPLGRIARRVLRRDTLGWRMLRDMPLRPWMERQMSRSPRAGRLLESVKARLR